MKLSKMFVSAIFLTSLINSQIPEDYRINQIDFELTTLKTALLEDTTFDSYRKNFFNQSFSYQCSLLTKTVKYKSNEHKITSLQVFKKIRDLEKIQMSIMMEKAEMEKRIIYLIRIDGKQKQIKIINDILLSISPNRNISIY